MMDFLRTRALPWTVWLAAMAGAAFLWRDADVAPAQGFVDGARWSVAAPVAGTLASVVALPGQRVAAGDVLATLDDRELLAELDILAAEGRRIEAELAAVASDTAVRLGEATRGLEESVEAAERALQGARAERGVRAVELTAMTSQLDALKALVDKRMADRRDLDALAVKHAAVKKEVQSADARIAQLQSQVAAARSRRETLPSDAATRATDPLRAELSVVRQREELLRLRQEALTLRSPVAGEVTMVHLRAGEVAAAGASVASVAAAAGARVTVCMSEVSAAGVREGEAVELRRADGSTLRGRVERLGGEVAELPARCWQEARSPEWGKTATVVVEDEARLVPGEGFIVAFAGELSPRAAASDTAPTPTPATPTQKAPPATSAAPAPVVSSSQVRVGGASPRELLR